MLWEQGQYKDAVALKSFLHITQQGKNPAYHLRHILRHGKKTRPYTHHSHAHQFNQHHSPYIDDTIQDSFLRQVYIKSVNLIP